MTHHTLTLNGGRTRLAQLGARDDLDPTDSHTAGRPHGGEPRG